MARKRFMFLLIQKKMEQKSESITDQLQKLVMERISSFCCNHFGEGINILPLNFLATITTKAILYILFFQNLQILEKLCYSNVTKTITCEKVRQGLPFRFSSPPPEVILARRLFTRAPALKSWRNEREITDRGAGNNLF